MSCIELYFMGTGASTHPKRYQSSLAILYNGRAYVIDYGCTAHNMLFKMGLDPSDVDAYIFTHAHYDHLCGFPQTLFSGSFRDYIEYRVVADPRTWAVLRRMLSTIMISGGLYKPSITWIASPPLEDYKLADDIALTMKRARHVIESYYIMIEAGGHRIVISGDTAPLPELEALASSASVTIHEATLPDSVDEEVEYFTGHTRASTAAYIASKSRVGLLYHISPSSEEDAIAAAEKYANVSVPDDGSRYRIC